MRLAEFDFELPEERIALRPARPRDSARLLVVAPAGALSDRHMSDLPALLRPGDALVFNDTRVIAARLTGQRERDGNIARIEATLIERLSPTAWSALARPGKRLQIGDRIVFGESADRACALGSLEARIADRGEGGAVTLEFALAGDELDRVIDAHGAAPLPPYIASRRRPDEQDLGDYQTVYARLGASVAAPTAGLHFTSDLLRRLTEAGVTSYFVTLHVGAGTFLPVKSEDIGAHVMHAERGSVSAQTAAALNAARAAGGRVVAVGTTSLRLLESAANADGTIHPFEGETSLFITPGYAFRVAAGLLTNFHLPRSTLFILVSAFSGLRTMREAYAHAVATGYRFYSYGDASLLWRNS